MKTFKIVNGFLNPYGKDVPNIIEKVNGNLKAGFKLHGSLIHIQKNEYSQAMIYTKTEPEDT